MDYYESPETGYDKGVGCSCEYCMTQGHPDASMAGHIHVPYNYA